jgi:uncharacterized protein
MAGRVYPVTFPNRQGHMLVGIVHEPAAPSSDLAVLLLSPGIKNRVAPHRMYNKIAEALSDDGVRVLRFDFAGLGDSEGELSEEFLADLYGAIQVGRYVDDTRAAMDWMERTMGVREFLLGGLCGGAITGLLASVDDTRVVGLLAIGIPVVRDSMSIDPVRYMTVGQLHGIRQKYLRKLRDPRAWLRLLSLKSDLRLLTKSLATALKVRPDSSPTPTAAPAGDDGNVNPHFAPAFLRLVGNGRPALLVFSGGDRLYWEFESKFLSRHREAVAAAADLVDITVIPDANHVLTFDSWQQAMLSHVRGWVTTRFLRTEPAGKAVSF